MPHLKPDSLVSKLTGLCAAAATAAILLSDSQELQADIPLDQLTPVVDFQGLSSPLDLPPASYVDGTPLIISSFGSAKSAGSAMLFNNPTERTVTQVNFQVGANSFEDYNTPPEQLGAHLVIWFGDSGIGGDVRDRWIADPMGTQGNIEGRQAVRTLELTHLTKHGSNSFGGNTWQSSWKVLGPELVLPTGDHMVMIIGNNLFAAVQQSAEGPSTLIYAYNSGIYPASELWELRHTNNELPFTDKPLLVTFFGPPETNSIPVKEPKLSYAPGPEGTMNVMVSYNSPDVQLQVTTDVINGPWLPVGASHAEEADPDFAENGIRRTYTLPTAPAPPTGGIGPMDEVSDVPEHSFFRALNLDEAP